MEVYAILASSSVEDEIFELSLILVSLLLAVGQRIFTCCCYPFYKLEEVKPLFVDYFLSFSVSIPDSIIDFYSTVLIAWIFL